MPTYITLMKWTEQGIRDIKKSPSRVDLAKQAVHSAGGKWISFYMVTGRYDLVAITEAPDDMTYARVLLALASRGNYMTETLRAFTEDEFRSIVSGLT